MCSNGSFERGSLSPATPEFSNGQLAYERLIAFNRASPLIPEYSSRFRLTPPHLHQPGFLRSWNRVFVGQALEVLDQVRDLVLG